MSLSPSIQAPAFSAYTPIPGNPFPTATNAPGTPLSPNQHADICNWIKTNMPKVPMGMRIILDIVVEKPAVPAGADGGGGTEATSEYMRVLACGSVSSNNFQVHPLDSLHDAAARFRIGTHASALRVSSCILLTQEALPQAPSELSQLLQLMHQSMSRQDQEAGVRRTHEDSLRAIQERTAKAEEENAIRQTKIESRKHDTVYLKKSHNLDIANLPGLTEQQLGYFSDMAFPPLGAPASHGFTTATAVMLAHHAIHEGLRITQATKETELQKLADSSIDVRGLLTRVILMGGRKTLTPDDPKFDAYSVFFIGLEAIMVGPRFKAMFPDAKSRDGLRAKMCAAFGLTEPIRVSVESEKVRLSALMHDTLPILTVPNPFKYLDKADGIFRDSQDLIGTLKEKCKPQGGGASQDAAPPVGAVVDALPELAPQRYISSQIIDAVIRPLNSLLGKRFQVLYPDAIRQTSAQSVANGIDTARRHKKGFLAPALLGGNHWVLIVGTHDQGQWNVLTYDSLPSQSTRQELASTWKDIVAKAPQLENAVVSAAIWPRQPPSSNDCALFVMRAALVSLAPHITTTRAQLFFSRNDLRSIFARTIDESNGVFPSTLSSAQFSLIAKDLKTYFEKKSPKPVLAVPESLEEEDKAPVSRIPKAFIERLSKAQAGPASTIQAAMASAPPPTSNPPPVRPMASPLVQMSLLGAPVPGSKCPFIKKDIHAPCGRHLKRDQGVTCTDCGRRFCAEHFNHNMVQRPDWKCVECRETKRYSVRCAFPGCAMNHGLVDILHARICSSCTRPFHNSHHKVPAGQDFMCTECRSGQDRELPEGDFSMPQDPTRDAQDFLTGQGSPFLTARQGTLQFITRLKDTLDSQDIHPLAQVGLKPTTREAHMRALNLLLTPPRRCHNWPLARTAIEILELERKRGNKGRGKTWSTTNTWVGNMAGALTRLPMYTRGRMDPVDLSLDPEWRDAAVTTSRMARQFSKTGLPAATQAEVMQAIRTARDPKMAAALIINWACMARIGDTLQLQTKHISITRSATGPARIVVYYCEGKVIGRGKVDPYHVHADLPDEMATALTSYLCSVSTKHLFHMKSKVERTRYTAEIRNHLRSINPSLDCRSLRRGALQTYASTPGVTMQMVLYYSKHTDLGMLRRYLRFGKAVSEENLRAATHTISLWR